MLLFYYDEDDARELSIRLGRNRLNPSAIMGSLNFLDALETIETFQIHIITNIERHPHTDAD